MAYYDALIAKWATLTPGTTTAKIAQINAITVSGNAVPMVIPTYKIYNLIVASDFAALSAANQQLIRDIIGMGTVDTSPGTQARAKIVAVFPNGTATFASLSGLAAQYDSPPILGQLLPSHKVVVG
jgi:hypothetical protein